MARHGSSALHASPRTTSLVGASVTPEEVAAAEAALTEQTTAAHHLTERLADHGLGDQVTIIGCSFAGSRIVQVTLEINRDGDLPAPDRIASALEGIAYRLY